MTNKNFKKATFNLSPANPVELIMGWPDFITALSRPSSVALAYQSVALAESVRT